MTGERLFIRVRTHDASGCAVRATGTIPHARWNPPNHGMGVASLLSMATPPKMALSEIQLLQREIEAQGEWLNRERLERKTETDRLRLEVETLKRILSRLHPEFAAEIGAMSEQVRQEYDPEA